MFSVSSTRINRTSANLLLLFFFLYATVGAAEYYVAPNGRPNAPGTRQQPFSGIQQGQAAASPGDTVHIRGGLYAFSGNSAVGVLFDKSGSNGRRINYWAYPGETPVFDFFNLTPQARITGFQIRADWLYLRGLEMRGVQQVLTNVNESWCVHIQGSDNIFELLDMHHNEGPGLFIKSGGDNSVLNCDSHHNYDGDRGGENADGFGCHSIYDGNVFSGCRAWWNSDDGFDFINSPGVCTVEKSWAFYNGYIPGTRTSAGNGAGIKAGGFGLTPPTDIPIPRHQVRFNLSFENRTQGFYANHHPGGIDWINNTAFGNPKNFDMLADVGAANHFLRNNLAAGTGTALAQATSSEIDDGFNSWSLSVRVSNADFLSTAAVNIDGPRKSDGSLPDLDFLKLAPGSDLINAGIKAGFLFQGSAPDLGFFEYGPVVGPSRNRTAAVSPRFLFSEGEAYRNIQGRHLKDSRSTRANFVILKTGHVARVVSGQNVRAYSR